MEETELNTDATLQEAEQPKQRMPITCPVEVVASTLARSTTYSPKQKETKFEVPDD